MKVFRLGSVSVLAAALSGCNVSNTTADSGGAGPRGDGSCPSGLSVVLSDYASTQVALSSLTGDIVSKSFMSTGSAKTDGLSFALSGDVVLPSARTPSGRVVLIDRFGTNVITWADPESAKVLGQLAIGTGFESNPSDYLELDAERAFVSRFGSNRAPGKQPFDAGGDLLLIDTARQEITGSVPIEATEDLPPRPTGMLRVGDTVLVSLARVSFDFATTGDSELLGVSALTSEIEFRTRYAGLKNCGHPVASPNGETLAVACTGQLDINGNVEKLEESALLLLDARSMPPSEVKRFSALELAGEPLQSELAFARDTLILFKTQTAVDGRANNRWLALDLDTGATTTLLAASPDAAGRGRGLLYGAISCSPGCSDVCLLADADRGVLERVRFDPQNQTALLDPVSVDTASGLPPRDLIER